MREPPIFYDTVEIMDEIPRYCGICNTSRETRRDQLVHWLDAHPGCGPQLTGIDRAEVLYRADCETRGEWEDLGIIMAIVSDGEATLIDGRYTQIPAVSKAVTS